jgi:hypothetical protein
VVTACVQAANVWAAGDATGGERWRRVAELHGLVSLSHLAYDGRALPVVEFVDRLDGPLAGLLPGQLREECDDLALLDDGELSGDAADLLRENLAPSVTAEQVAEWGWRSLNAEKVQGWLYGKLLETGTQDGYVAARLTVIRHAAGEMVAINDRIKQVGLPREGLYEPIPGWAWVSRGGERYWFACPICRWPMRFQLDRVTCRYPAHQRVIGSVSVRWPRSGAPQVGSRRRSRVRAITVEEEITARPVEGHISLVHPVWRYSTIPGLEEWWLADTLNAIPGVTAQLWPKTDSYDLLVQIEARGWKRQLDLKDYTDPGRLAAELGRKQALRAADMLIVVPGHRAHQVALLNERLRHSFGMPRRRFVVTTQQVLSMVNAEVAKMEAR